MKRKRKLILILILLIIVLLGVVIYFIYSREIVSKNKALEKQKELLIEEEKIDEDAIKLDEINNLNLENEHVVGWIKINDSKIDYPILYSGDDYYIYYNYKKERG